MHPSVYREFHVSLAPDVESRELARGVTADEAVLYVRLCHHQTGQDAVFKLLGDTGSPERWIEEQVMRQFPDSVAAGELRALYGQTRHRLKQGWEHAFGDRIFAGISNFCDSNGARYWEALIPTLPSVLYSTMNVRAVTKLSQLGDEVDLKTVIKAVHDAWLAVLKEARSIKTTLSGLQRLALDLSGWPTDHLKGMSMLEYGRFQEKAQFARLALAYLQDEDWTGILTPILEDIPPATDTEHNETVSES
ncbi:hypothetical protein WJ96_05905 [Burkholderia ubonensis]|uniref:Uncharacterized protein n=1 Tax=Burkholderia ubonensis TaxID=101571 RepID=A0AAW3MVY2_9BURK|nr:hypothetical protein [Burkholderia ubonensis]KVP75290.1 hypothetical protein WJ93_07700 [Burkholderia ubonensis]KVP98103.1 hypothetical protein WJ96_05905 [Burkholderia ubonensis]KVZ92800.1 hypothetical protein WL25_17565 [Burkholderia ubonensis]